MTAKTTRIPSATELLEAVAGYLDGRLLPAIEQGEAVGQKFNLRVVVNVLGIVQRELAQQPDESVCRDLGKLLGSENTHLESQLLTLAEKIRAGNFSEDDANLLAVLRRHTLNRLAVDNPKYSGYQAAAVTASTDS